MKGDVFNLLSNLKIFLYDVLKSEFIEVRNLLYFVLKKKVFIL